MSHRPGSQEPPDLLRWVEGALADTQPNSTPQNLPEKKNYNFSSLDKMRMTTTKTVKIANPSRAKWMWSRVPPSFPAVDSAEHGCALTVHATKALFNSASSSCQKSTELSKHFSNYGCLLGTQLRNGIGQATPFGKRSHHISGRCSHFFVRYTYPIMASMLLTKLASLIWCELSSPLVLTSFFMFIFGILTWKPGYAPIPFGGLHLGDRSSD